MALHRGIQSAIFFYLSCAPCADARYRKRRKREAAWDRAAREELAGELPDAYRHPSPSSTNPHWQTEIALGPTGVVRGKKKSNAAQDPRRTVQRAPTALSMTSTADSRSERDMPGHEREAEGWNHRPYQRDDEELWGSLNNLHGTLQLPARVRTKDSTSSCYHPMRNPPISDLHPATVTRVSSREEVLWMMQPTPVAEVMNGKERACRSRSDSGGGRRSPAMSASTLSRNVSSRLHDRRVRAGEGSATAMSRESSLRTSKMACNNQIQPTTTQLSFTSVSSRDFALSPTSSRREADDSEDSSLTILHHNQCTQRTPTQRAASRPQLSTITSASDLPTAILSPPPPSRIPTPTDLPDLVNERSNPSPPQSRDSALTATTSPTPRQRPNGAPRPPSVSHRHSASILVKTGKELQLLQRMSVSPRRSNGHLRTHAGIEYNSSDVDVDLDVEVEEDAMLTVRGADGRVVQKTAREAFESWYGPDFELGTWVLEHTKREGVRERWSMDF